MLRELFQSITVQQDYWWFCALLLWSGVVAAYLLPRTKVAVPSGAIWGLLTIGSGAGIALVELVAHIAPPGSAGAQMAYRDLLLFFLQFLQAVSPLALFFPRERGVGRLTLLLGATALFPLLRSHDYYAWDLVAQAIVLIASIRATQRLPARATRPKLAIWLGNLTFLLGTTGLLSEVLHQQQRFLPFSYLAMPSAAAQAALAGVWLSLLLPDATRQLLNPAGFQGEPRRRWLGAALLFWLSAGFFVAGLTARSARINFEQSLLARVRVCTALIRPEGIDAILQPRFQVEELHLEKQANGSELLLGKSAHLLTAGRVTRHDLMRIQEANPDIYWAFFMTLRSGFLVSPAVAQNLPAAKDVIGIERTATAKDLTDWAERRSFVEGPLLLDYEHVLRVSAPVLTSNGRMGGWLVFETGVESWYQVQAVARFQTLAVVGLGCGLWLLMLVIRQRTAAQEKAERQAAVAAAADQAKSIFLSKVSHELRTPVQSILGYAELLGAEENSAERPRWAQIINVQSRMLIRLVNDLIDLSALQAGAFRLRGEPGQIGPLVRQTVEALQPAAQARGLDLIVEIGPDLPPWLLLDETRLRQIAFNLIGNAIKFTDRGSVRVRLTAGPAVPPPGPVSIVLSVRDTGPGIPLEDQQRLFSLFRRLDRDAHVEGAGLGLALGRALCEKMGGTITVESDGLHGSLFTATWLLVPCAEPPAPAETPALHRLVGRRVLVVDDNPLVAEYYVTVLRNAGAWCDHATNGLQAISLAAAGAYDVVVTDLAMPGLNGFEVCRQILANGGRIPRIIGVSAHVQPGERDRAADAGMESLLLKPLSSRDLLAAVAQLAVPTSISPSEDLALIRRLRVQFHQELPGLRQALVHARTDGDLARTQERLHYLKNSADVVRYAELSALCAHAESLVTQDADDFQRTMDELLAFLAHSPLQDDTPLFRPPPEK